MTCCMLLLLAASLAASPLLAQDVPPMARDAMPAFEVATIKPTPPEERSQGFQTHGAHVRMVRETVLSMVMFAYGIHGKQLVDGPDWIGTEAFDVDGIPDTPGEPNFAQMQTMVKGLLHDRFGLRFHEGKRDLSFYALRVSPGGPKIVKTASPPDTSADQTGNGSTRGQTMNFTSNSMDEFSLGMQYFVDRPIVNETALPGRYDFTLRWQPNELKVDEPDSAPSLFTATREQLGLKLDPTKGPVTVMLVDALTKPSAN